jgi:hypothetical protein
MQALRGRTRPPASAHVPPATRYRHKKTADLRVNAEARECFQQCSKCPSASCCERDIEDLERFLSSELISLTALSERADQLIKSTQSAIGI